MASKITKAAWYQDKRGFIEDTIIEDATDWLNSLGYETITYLDLNSESHELKATGKNRGKVAYIGSINAATNGKPYITLTVINQRASVPNETYKNSGEIVNLLWENRNTTNPKPRKKRAVKPRHIETQEQREARQKKENVLRDKALFGRLSNDPQNNQAAYLDDKGITGFIPRGKVRYGTDKHGDFAVIQLFNIKGEFVGLQRFYDRKIKGRNTNKDFTWGLVKSGAYHLLGDIDKDYAGIAYICEGYADGAVSYGQSTKPVFIALDAYNLDAVAQAVKAQYPKAQGIIICDNDAQKYDKGIDNIGVFFGVMAAIKAGYQYVIPDFSSYDQSSKPKDLWDLWQLGGDEAVSTLLNAPQTPPTNWDEFQLNFVGLPSFWKGIDKIIKKTYRLGNPLKTISAIKKAAATNVERLGLNITALLEYAKDATDNALQSLIKRVTVTYSNRLIAPDKEVDTQWLSIPLDHKTIVIDSGLGTGKTQWIKQNCFNNLMLEEVLNLLPRRTLAKNLANRLGAADYEDVKSVPGKRSGMDASKLVCVPNSLVTLDFTGNEQLDCIVLDEVELLIHHLFSKAVKESEREDMLRVLKGLIKNADYVIGAQAQITSLTTDFLKACGREDIYVVRNKYQRFKDLPVDFYIKETDCFDALTKLIDEDKPVIVPCTSKKKAVGLALELQDKYPDKRILLYHSENRNEPEQMQVMADINRKIIDVDVFIHSPALEQGVSIDVSHFENVVGFCTVGTDTGTPDSFTQMMFRTRGVKHAAIWVDSRIDNQPEDYQKYLAEEIARFGIPAEEMVIDGQKVIVFKETDDVILSAKSKAARKAAKNHTQGETYAILKHMGCDVNIIEPTDKDNKAARESLKRAKEKQQAEHDKQVDDAKPITSQKCQEIEDSNKATEGEYYEVKRHKLERETVTDLTNLNTDEKDAVFKFWNQGKAQKVIYALGMAILNPILALAITEYLLKNQPQSSESQAFRTQWIIRTGILESLRIRFINGVMMCNLGFEFTFADLKKSHWYKWACEHKDAVNGSNLGARMQGDAPSDKEIGMWIGAMGIRLSSKQIRHTVRKTTPLPRQNLVTYLACNIIKKEKARYVTENVSLVYQPNKHGDVGEKRDRVRVYKVNTKATKVVDDKPQASKTEAWRLIRDGILAFLHIRLNDGVWEYDTDFQFQAKDLRETQWYKWACENKDVINAADLGAKIKDDAPSDRALTCWIRKMGIKLTSKQIDAHKLEGDSTQKSCGKKATKERDRVRRYQVNITAMTPLTNTLTRRHKANDMPWTKIAQAQLDQNALDLADDNEFVQSHTEKKAPAPTNNNEPTMQTDDNLAVASKLLALLLEWKAFWQTKQTHKIEWLAMMLSVSKEQILRAADTLPVRIIPATNTTMIRLT